MLIKHMHYRSRSITSRLGLVAIAFVLMLPFAPRLRAAGEYILLARYASMPGDTFDVHGVGFTPYQPVVVSFESMHYTVMPDGGGNFASPAFTVPFRLPGSYAVNATQVSSGLDATGSMWIDGYYPWGGPSTYYVLPGQPLGFYGRHFAPNEQVKLYDGAGTLIQTFTADGGGNFDTANTIATVPFSWKLTTPSYKMVGQMTGAVSTFDLVVGTYYPNVTPSSYYVAMNAPMSIDARNFAPNEPVDIYINGGKVTTKTADGGGNVVLGFTSPGSGMSFEIKGVGQWSGAQSVRNVTLAQPGWAI